MSTQETKKILIVEDDMIIAMVLEKMLTRLNYQVVGKLINGQEAIAKTPELQPDLILMDIKLKDNIDGITVMKQIRQHSDIPVIYITGNSDQFNIERAKESGFISYLVKPIQMKDLERSLKKAFP